MRKELEQITANRDWISLLNSFDISTKQGCAELIGTYSSLALAKNGGRPEDFLSIEEIKEKYGEHIFEFAQATKSLCTDMARKELKRLYKVVKQGVRL